MPFSFCIKQYVGCSYFYLKLCCQFYISKSCLNLACFEATPFCELFIYLTITSVTLRLLALLSVLHIYVSRYLCLELVCLYWVPQCYYYPRYNWSSLQKFQLFYLIFAADYTAYCTGIVMALALVYFISLILSVFSYSYA